MKLLCGFYHPNKGQILINGREISDYPETEYRKLVGAVFQDMIGDGNFGCRKHRL